MLFCVEVVVAAALGVERFVRAAFDDAAAFDDQDLLGAAYGGQPVRDHKCRAPAHQVAQPFLDQRFGFGVQAGGSFVQDQDARIGEDGARDRHALLLPAGQADAAFTHDRVVLLLETLGEFIHASDAASLQDFLFAGRRVAQTLHFREWCRRTENVSCSTTPSCVR